ncbi:hypothetical protein Fmac_026617 [Flemingia macrophylla]|uniref:Uncharacterized protein n=1 Tax=Flemingia macrophylla TaxID=520843 RepID=A0ABD1LFM2_9FABA
MKSYSIVDVKMNSTIRAELPIYEDVFPSGTIAHLRKDHCNYTSEDGSLHPRVLERYLKDELMSLERRRQILKVQLSSGIVPTE